MLYHCKTVRNFFTEHVFSLILILIFLLHPEQAYAVCINGRLSVGHEYAVSSYVFIGRLVSETRIEESADGYFLDGSEEEIQVEKFYKSVNISLMSDIKLKSTNDIKLKVFVENSSGRVFIEKYVEYILFLYEDHGRLLINSCGNSGILDVNGSIFTELNRISSQNK